MTSIRVPSAARRPVKRVQADALEIKEAGFQTQVVDLAVIRGWHLRTRDTSIDLPGIMFHPTIAYRSEPGWPDLTLVRRRDRRILFAELKTDKKTSVVKPRQEQVLAVLADLVTTELDALLRGPFATREAEQLAAQVRRLRTRVDVVVWRPSQWAEIERVLL